MKKIYEKILDIAIKTHNISKEEIIILLKEGDELLYKAADDVRRKFKGDNVHLRGLIEFSNICRCNCNYCGLRRDNKKIDRYRLSEDQIIKFAGNALNAGYKTFVLQSGEDMYWDTERLCNLIKKLKENDIALTLSIGERSYEEYKAFKKAGADRYLLRIETSDKKLYETLHPGMSYENRIRCLYDLKELDYETGTGVIAGLPGQSVESLADDILFFKKLDADMIGIGPLIPHKETPLARANADNFDIALKVMAITRLLLPDINIPATTAMESIRPNGRIIALKSGANVVMPDMTEGDYRRKYEIYPGRICINDAPSNCINCIKSKILSIGRSVSVSKGFRNDTF